MRCAAAKSVGVEGMRALDRVRAWLFESPWWLFVTILSAVMVVRTGIWGMPGIFAQRRLAIDPFTNPFLHDPHNYYLIWNWLGPFIAWALGLKSRFGFIAMYAAFSVAYVALFVRIAITRIGHDQWRKAVILFFVLPVSATSFYNLGYDSLTLFLMMLALSWPRQIVVTVAAGILLGMQHFEIALVATTALCAFSLLRYKSNTSDYTLKFSVPLLISVILGHGVLLYIFQRYAIETDPGRTHYVLSELARITSTFFFRMHVILWSICGVGWLAVMRYADGGRSTAAFFVTLVGTIFVFVPIVDDQTRVACLITFPLIAVALLLNKEWLATIDEREAALLWIISTLSAWSWVLTGNPRSSAFPFDLAAVAHYMLGWPDVPDVAFMQWPFL